MRTEPLEPRRIRYPKGAWGWVDLRIVTEGHLRGLGQEAALVYLFLCTVGNREGISFWSQASISQMLNLTPEDLARALAALIAADLIATNDRIVQVLPVPDSCRGQQGDRGGAPRGLRKLSDDKAKSRRAAQPKLPLQPMPLEISEDEIRAHEAEARNHIARFYGARKPSASVVRALARSLARKERR